MIDLKHSSEAQPSVVAADESNHNLQSPVAVAPWAEATKTWRFLLSLIGSRPFACIPYRLAPGGFM